MVYPISDTPTLWMSLAAWQLNNDCNQQLLKSPRHERIMVQSGELSATVPLPSTLAESACNAAGKISEVAVFLFVQTLLQQERRSWRKDCEVRFWIQGCVGLQVWQRKHIRICTHQEPHGLRFLVFDFNSAWMIVLLYSFAQDSTLPQTLPPLSSLSTTA